MVGRSEGVVLRRLGGSEANRLTSSFACSNLVSGTMETLAAPSRKFCKGQVPATE